MSNSKSPACKRNAFTSLTQRISLLKTLFAPLDSSIFFFTKSAKEEIPGRTSGLGFLSSFNWRWRVTEKLYSSRPYFLHPRLNFEPQLRCPRMTNNYLQTKSANSSQREIIISNWKLLSSKVHSLPWILWVVEEFRSSNYHFPLNFLWILLLIALEDENQFPKT